MNASYSKGLEELGTGIYAYLQPNGSWGWSNAGLITSEGSSMLVDTLYTLEMTRKMIEAMRRSIPAARSFDTLVNSHADGDHTWGNQLIEGAQIIATENTAEDLRLFMPEAAMRLKSGDPALGIAGRYVQQIFRPFDFSEIEVTLPTRTFTGTLSLQVGEKTVDLHQIGPAHSRGDLIVHVPADRVAYVADLLFIGGHPAMWSGPVEKWIDACNRIIDLDVDHIVPGHGPVTDADGARQVRDYLEYVVAEGKRFHGEGLSPYEAGLAIDISAYGGWTDEERIVLAMHTIYREVDPEAGSSDLLELFAEMGRYMDRKGLLR
jgi:glyoxylase-like metal-dependent hydrolase (beta-lactamase superfamily II)